MSKWVDRNHTECLDSLAVTDVTDAQLKEQWTRNSVKKNISVEKTNKNVSSILLNIS